MRFLSLLANSAGNEVAASSTPVVEAQDPLPENNWFWRRAFTFSICAMVFVGQWFEIQALLDETSASPELIVGALVQIIKWQYIIAWCAMTYYLIAPSAEQLGKWLATVSAWKAGVTTKTTQTATAPDGATARATTTAGVPSSPPSVAAPSEDDEFPPPPPLPPLAVEEDPNPKSYKPGVVPWER